MSPIEEPPEPWRSFLADVDSRLDEEICLHCCGGFVVTQLYGVRRSTSDVDFLGVVPYVPSRLIGMAGKGTDLHRKHKLYLDAVTVATPPEDYEQRPAPCSPEGGPICDFTHWRLMTLRCRSWSGTSIGIATTSSNSHAGHLSQEILKERYYRELRPNLLGHEARHDLTLQLWLESWPA